MEPRIKMQCRKCEKEMASVKDVFHGFPVMAWKCPGCGEIVYDEKQIQPILEYNKLKSSNKGLMVTVGKLGESKILRIPKVAEQLYKIGKGEKLRLELKPEGISIRIKT